jgi:Uma2 family endonuclease
MSEKENEINMVMPADWIPGARQGDWTYDMYAALPNDGHRYEVVKGVLVVSPAPEPAHQGVVGAIYRYLYQRLADRGLVLVSPVDVLFSSKKTVQPDVLVLLDEHQDRLKEKYVAGAPDLAVEVISPGSITYDRLVKYDLYEQEGVSEYWLVNRKEQTIEVFALEAGKYYSLGIFRGEQTLLSRIVPGPLAPVSQFFKGR